MFSFDNLNCRVYKFYSTFFLSIVLAFPSAMTAQVSITAVDLPVIQNFNTLATSGSSALMPPSWVFLETGIGANTTYTVDNGSLSTNDTYSYGTGAATERALGQLNGVIANSMGASFINNTGTTITSLVIQYVGEQWRLGATGRTDRLDFQYSTNATAINNGVWTDVNAFDFTAPVTAGAIGALDGNAAANRKVVANTLSGLSIANGATFWIRWNSFDATGNDDGLSIDDFALTANPALHYTISNVAGTLTITDTDGNGDELDVTQSGTNLRLNAPGRTYSLNAGATTSLPVDIALAGLSNIVINTNSGHDTINVGAFTSSLPNLTINGGVDDDIVNMNGDINFLSNSFLNLDLQNDAVTPGIDQVYIAPSTNLGLSGSGEVTIKVSRNITLGISSSILTANGAITLEANQQATPATGSFQGINMASGSLIQATGNGVLTIRGKGGTSGAGQRGIENLNGDIVGGLTGTMLIEGFGGASTSGSNDGIRLFNGGAITSNGANITINGTAGGTGSLSTTNAGVNVSTNSFITAQGAGHITITAHGGPATGQNQFGLSMGSSSSITTTSGNILVNGYGGDNATSSYAHGVVIIAGQIKAGGSGTVTVNGEGGSSTGGDNYGVYLHTSPAKISSSGGAVTVWGQGGGTGSSWNNTGIVVGLAATISSEGTGSLTVNGTGGPGTGNNNFGLYLNAASALISSEAGSVTILGNGGGTGTSANGVGIKCVGNITSTANGNVDVQGFGGIGTGGNQHGLSVEGVGGLISSSGTLHVTGTGGEFSTITGANYGVYITNSGTILNANANVTGYGGGTGSTGNNHGVYVNTGGKIEGNIVSVSGTGGAGSGNINFGVFVTGANSYISSSGTCNVFGQGGGTMASANNYGIAVTNNGTIKDLALIGDVLIEGVGGLTTGSFNHGVWISDNASITSLDEMTVTGYGGGNGTSSVNVGVYLSQTGIIHAGQSNTGDLHVTGYGGNTAGTGNNGIYVADDGSLITSGNGVVYVYGECMGEGTSASSGVGVYVYNGKITAGSLANVFITGIGSPGTGSNNYGVKIEGPTGTITSSGGSVNIGGTEGGSASSYGITISNNAQVTTAANGGAIQLASNSMLINGLVTTMNTNEVWLLPQTNGVDINLGSIGDIVNGPLQLSDQELDSIFTGTLYIGNLNSGTITTTNNITRTSSTTINLGSADDIILDAGSINTSGGNLKFDPGAAPDAVKAIHAGNDVMVNTVLFDGPVDFVINGAVADAGYTQLNVVGAVNLTNTTFQYSGTYTPTAGQTFILIQNDGADPVIGTFSGIPEGSTFTSFLGSAYPATISYVGGTGNDVVITVASPHYLLSTTGNQIVFTDIAGNSETITMSQDGANNVMFTVPGRTYSWNGGVVTALPVSTSLGGMTMVTVNAGTGNDNINVDAFTVTMCNLTLNGGVGNDQVNMNGDITFSTNAKLDIDLQNDNAVPGTDVAFINNGVNLNLQGTGTAALKASKMVHFGSSASLVTVNGNLTIEANQQATPTSGNFYGVYMPTNSLAEVAGTGILSVKGKGGTSENAQIGIYLHTSAILKGGTVGTHYITGTGGLSSGSYNCGIQVQLGAAITTNGGNLSVSGQGGGTGTSAYNSGIFLVQDGEISAGGMGSVTINAIGGLPTGIRNHGIHISNTGSMVTSGGGNVYVYGLSGGTGPASYNHGVFVQDYGMITAGGMGTVTIDGYGGNAVGERNDGVICFQQGSKITSGGGDVHINGHGGGTDSSFWNFGVMVDYNAQMTVGGMGDLFINGTGGPTTGEYNIGVYVYNGSQITTSGGDVHVNGDAGGIGAANYSIGVLVRYNSTITAGGLGNVFVDGLGGNTTGTRNDGVFVETLSSSITSSGGNVEVIGQGRGHGDSYRCYGVYLNNVGIISAGGNGTVNVQGAGSTESEGYRNYGVVIGVTGSKITSSGGNITVNGVGGGSGPLSDSNFGVYLTSGSIIAPGNATIDIDGTGGNSTGPYNYGVLTIGAPSIISSNNGDINIVGHANGHESTSFYNYGVRIDANLVAGGSGNVNIEAYGSMGGAHSSYGFVSEGGDISTQGGDINVFGQGGGTGAATWNMGFYMGAGAQMIAGGIGNVNIQGIGGMTTGGSNIGVYAQHAGTLISSNGGDVSVTGNAGLAPGNGSYNYGIYVLNGAKISAGGNGEVNVEGTGGAAGHNNFGIVLNNPGAAITSSGGDIEISAQGGGSGATGNQIGFLIQNAASVAASGNGNVFIEANGGSSNGAGNHGILIYYNGANVTTVDGDIEINGDANGTAGASSSVGVYMIDGKVQSTGTGNIILEGHGLPTANYNAGVLITNPTSLVSTSTGDISITGTPGSGTNANGIWQTNGAQIHTLNEGNIKLVSNSIRIESAMSTQPADTIFISPFDNDTAIFLGPTTNPNEGPLMLSDAELDFISTGTLMIGANTAGTITVQDTITRAVATIVNLTSSHDVLFEGGMLNTNGGDSKIAAGSLPAAVKPFQYGTDIACGQLTFDGELSIRINGAVADTSYDQMNVIGSVDLTGVELILSGTYTPAENDSFVIVLNDGVDAVIDRFVGLVEGDTLYNFIGSDLDATITYAGGTGNDVVIRVPSNCLAPTTPLLVGMPDTICAGDMVTLSVLSGNLGGATEWHWYANACDDVPVGTGNSIQISPSETTSYYARAEGGCVTISNCGTTQVVVNEIPDASIQHTFASPCYYTNQVFQPAAASIPGATYQWNFGANAIPANATGYGPHAVQYTTSGSKSVKLVIHPNAAGAQCPDSSTVLFTIDNCPGQVLGRVQDTTGTPIVNVNVKLFVDADANGIPDSIGAIRNVFTSANGTFSMASLIPKNYLIIQTQPNNWISFDDGDLTPDGDVLVNFDSLDNIIPVSIIASKIDSNNVFHEVPSSGTITGNVFDDINFNQIPNPGEGLQNVTVQLFTDNNTDGQADSGIPVATTVTTASGAYSFLNIPPGHYVLVETNPLNFISIQDFDPTADGDAVPNTNMNNDTLPLTLLSNESDMDNYFIDGAGCSLIVTNTNDSGAGSLRHAISCAMDGDTIRFHQDLSGESITLESGIIEISSDVVIMSNLSPRVSIVADQMDLFYIMTDAEVEFHSIDVTSGFGTADIGAAFHVEGSLMLLDVDINKNPFLTQGVYLIHALPSAIITMDGVVNIYE